MVINMSKDEFKIFEETRCRGFYYSNLTNPPKHQILAVINKASFERWGAGGEWWALNLELNLDNGFSTNWSFPLKTQIGEFLNMMKVNSLTELKGKPVYALYSSKDSQCIQGIGINERLVV